jgi:acyl-CoA thioester hydrolase
MPGYHFYYPVEIRFSDLDPLGHVNNARYLTYLEQARIAYFQHLGLWTGVSFIDIGIILADVQITFRAPILYQQKVQAGVRVARLGNKSLTMEYCLEEQANGFELATASTVLVSYDYRTNSSIPIPDSWRSRMEEFEKYGK